MQEPTEKLQRLVKVRDRLRSDWDLRNEKLSELAKGLAIENDPATKFKLEKQVRTATSIEIRVAGDGSGCSNAGED